VGGMFSHLLAPLHAGATLPFLHYKTVQIYHGIRHKMYPQDSLLHKHLEFLEPPFLPLLQPVVFQTSFVLKMKKNYMLISQYFLVGNNAR
jgi:hypothetical protein